MITKTNEAVSFTAQEAQEVYKLLAEVKTSIDGSRLINVNGTIHTSGDIIAYIGSFSINEVSQSINTNSTDTRVLCDITEAVSIFVDELLTPVTE